MKIVDIYKEKKPLFSCEVFPPKPENGIDTLYSTISGLEKLSPDFISVTYGAGGGTRERTAEIASRIKNDYGTEALMHLTCINTHYADLKKIIKHIDDLHIENILALRGDMPPEEGRDDDTISDFCYAVDLIYYLKQQKDFCIGVAGYPETHPESPDPDTDVSHLKNKIENGGDFIITQLFFDNTFFYRFLDRISSSGIDVPVSAGIMPVFKAGLIKKMVSLCGATIPPVLQKLIDKYQDKPKDMQKAGIEFASGQILDLIEQQVAGIHLYTMNNALLAEKIAKNTKLR
ncbi:MAG: methylenetetrahydrofolate reductase [NAD(P)H] [Elusimicrobia bacterium]|nr:methylenetetrahydrofolate reductase [NAD(P)H] [Elusimicrobiota bacterium]